jgi:hypothetical protein
MASFDLFALTALTASARIRHAKIHAASGRVQSSEWDDLPGRREYS